MASLDDAPADTGFSVRQAIIRVDPRYFRPTEVETLLGDPTKAKEKLGWTPKITFAQMVTEMVHEDLEIARRDKMCQQSGFKVFSRHEQP